LKKEMDVNFQHLDQSVLVDSLTPNEVLVSKSNDIISRLKLYQAASNFFRLENITAVSKILINPSASIINICGTGLMKECCSGNEISTEFTLTFSDDGNTRVEFKEFPTRYMDLLFLEESGATGERLEVIQVYGPLSMDLRCPIPKDEFVLSAKVDLIRELAKVTKKTL
jgi:hypothetical protein